MNEWQRQEWVDLMLDECETWAVVGLADPRRTAYSIAELLQRNGKRIVPIHPDAPVVLGEQGYATLADVPFPVDVVDVFRRSALAGAVVDEAVAIGAGGVWLQLGVIDHEAAERARAGCRKRRKSALRRGSAWRAGHRVNKLRRTGIVPGWDGGLGVGDWGVLAVIRN